MSDRGPFPLRGLNSSLSRRATALAIGTEQDEWWSGLEGFRTAHVAGGPFSAAIESLEAHEEGPVAWAAAQARIEGGPVIRLSLVLVREDDEWRIVQSHASTPG